MYLLAVNQVWGGGLLVVVCVVWCVLFGFGLMKPQGQRSATNAEAVFDQHQVRLSVKINSRGWGFETLWV